MRIFRLLSPLYYGTVLKRRRFCTVAAAGVQEERKKKEEEEKEAVAVQTLQTLGLGFKAPVGFKKPTLGSSFKPKSSGAAPKKAIPPPPPGFGSLPNAAGAKGDDSESDEE